MGQAVAPVRCGDELVRICGEDKNEHIEELHVARADLIAFEEGVVGAPMSREVSRVQQVVLAQKEGYATVRVFDRPEVGANVVGEIPSQSQAEWLIDESTASKSFVRVKWQDVEGWVGVKNVQTKQEAGARPFKNFTPSGMGTLLGRRVPDQGCAQKTLQAEKGDDAEAEPIIREESAASDLTKGRSSASVVSSVASAGEGRPLVAEIKLVLLVQKEGHPTVRVFEEPQQGAITIGEIPSQSEAEVCVNEADPSSSFYRVKWRDVEGWVGAKNIRDKDSADESTTKPATKTPHAGVEKAGRAMRTPRRGSDASSERTPRRGSDASSERTSSRRGSDASVDSATKSSRRGSDASVDSATKSSRRGSDASVDSAAKAAAKSPHAGSSEKVRRRSRTPTKGSDGSEDAATKFAMKSPASVVEKQLPSALDLKNAGYTLQDLVQAEFAASDLKEAGYSASQLKDAGYTLEELKRADFSVSELKKAKYTAVQLRQPFFSVQELKTANYSVVDLKESGCTAQQLKEEGYALEVLRAAGYNFNQLIEAGFTYDQFKKAGYTFHKLKRECTAQMLKAAGCAAWKLRKEGHSIEELKEAGFSLGDMKVAGYAAGDLRKKGYNCQDMKSAGFTTSELVKGGFSSLEVKEADPDHGVEELKDAGCTSWELKQAGYTIRQISGAGFTAIELKEEGMFKADDLATAGHSAKDLKDAGYTLTEKFWCCKDEDLIMAGYTQKQLLMEKHHFWHKQRQERREQRTPRRAGA